MFLGSDKVMYFHFFFILSLFNSTYIQCMYTIFMPNMVDTEVPFGMNKALFLSFDICVLGVFQTAAVN